MVCIRFHFEIQTDTDLMDELIDDMELTENSCFFSVCMIQEPALKVYLDRFRLREYGIRSQGPVAEYTRLGIFPGIIMTWHPDNPAWNMMFYYMKKPETVRSCLNTHITYDDGYFEESITFRSYRGKLTRTQIT